MEILGNFFLKSNNGFYFESKGTTLHDSRAYQIQTCPIFRHAETLVVSLEGLKIISLEVIKVWGYGCYNAAAALQFGRYYFKNECTLNMHAFPVHRYNSTSTYITYF
jgi:hypothetical protein